MRRVVWLSAWLALSACRWFGGPRADVPELSGLVASRAHPGVFWAHGDSGNDPILYAIDERARTLARVTVDGASSVDWEDVTLDRHGNLYIGDIGNNDSDRDDLAIHVLREPPLRNGLHVRPLRTIRFRYPDQGEKGELLNFDAEALFTLGDALFIASKHLADTKTTLYRVPLAPARGEVVLEKITELSVRRRKKQKNGMVTGASASPDGKQVALLTYSDVLLFDVGGPRVLSGPVAASTAPPIAALEALTWDEHGILVGTERGRLRRVSIPARFSSGRVPPPGSTAR